MKLVHGMKPLTNGTFKTNAIPAHLFVNFRKRVVYTMADLEETLPKNQLTRIPQTSSLRRPSDVIPVEGEIQVLNGRGTSPSIKDDGKMDTLQLPKSALGRRKSREMVAGSRAINIMSADSSDEEVSRRSFRSRREVR